MGSASDPVRVAVALGSNLGNRESHLREAVAALTPYIESIHLSAFIETAPVGVGAQPMFLNAALSGRTTLTARALLDALLGIESKLGRERPYPGAPRTVDLDLILYGQERIDEPGLF